MEPMSNSKFSSAHTHFKLARLRNYARTCSSDGLIRGHRVMDRFAEIFELPINRWLSAPLGNRCAVRMHDVARKKFREVLLLRVLRLEHAGRRLASASKIVCPLMSVRATSGRQLMCTTLAGSRLLTLPTLASRSANTVPHALLALRTHRAVRRPRRSETMPTNLWHAVPAEAGPSGRPFSIRTCMRLLQPANPRTPNQSDAFQAFHTFAGCST